MSLRIEGGCTSLGGNQWRYDWQDTKGWHSETFVSPEGVRPKIGDSIFGGALVVNTKPIINNDPGFQTKGKRQDVWPIDNQDA